MRHKSIKLIKLREPCGLKQRSERRPLRLPRFGDRPYPAVDNRATKNAFADFARSSPGHPEKQAEKSEEISSKNDPRAESRRRYIHGNPHLLPSAEPLSAVEFICEVETQRGVRRNSDNNSAKPCSSPNRNCLCIPNKQRTPAAAEG